MYIDFSSIFHQSSKDLRDKGRVYIAEDSSDWPKEWNTVYYKSYPRVKKIGLEKNAAPKRDFFDVVKSRHSTRKFKSESLSRQDLSRLLLYSVGEVAQVDPYRGKMRAYASGGARFPIEVYPMIFRGSDEIPAGVYHYNVREHALDTLWARPFTKEEIAAHFSYPWIQDASLALIFTAVFSRNQMKYGERGYRYVLLEAGHMSENIYLTAEALGIGCCAMGGFQDEKVERLLDIDGVSESLVHTLILGKKTS